MPAKDFLDLEEKKNLQKALKEEERAEVRLTDGHKWVKT
jgi:hypothetical protein